MTSTSATPSPTPLSPPHDAASRAGSVLNVACDSSPCSCVSTVFCSTISDIVGQLQNLRQISDFKEERKRVTNYWSAAQTAMLWDLVFDMGTDFDRIADLLNKDRILVKKKFLAMSKRNPNFGFVNRTA